MKYRIGETAILESPSLAFEDGAAVFTRNLEVGRLKEDLVIQVANLDHPPTIDGSTVIAIPAGPAGSSKDSKSKPTKQRHPISLDGNQFYQLPAKKFDMSQQDFSIVTRIKTKQDGTIFAKTRDQSKWLSQGKALFLRGGRPTFDIGWVGDVQANRKVNDGEWHEIVMNWSDGEVSFFVDGEPAGGGELQPKARLKQSVIRIGKTNDNFPGQSSFTGMIDDLRFYQRTLKRSEVEDLAKLDKRKLVAQWNHQAMDGLEQFGATKDAMVKALPHSEASVITPQGLLVTISGDELQNRFEWVHQNGSLRLKILKGPATSFAISHAQPNNRATAEKLSLAMRESPARTLKPLTAGGPSNYSQALTTKLIRGEGQGPFAVDVFERPKSNPWNCRLRLTGIDFMPDRNTAVVTAWDGSVWMVSGLGATEQVNRQPNAGKEELRWRRFAYGLFQPLGVKVVEGTPFVICRDQLVALHDLNGDGEADWYENFNSDHQVTEHFHEFAAGLQTDEQNNFYYAKCACHAKKAIVPQHGTLLKVSADGSRTEILANGFRAANGVCLNDDGTYFVTDQEGHWTPKNRINLVRQGGFYGNMLGYHDGVSESDDAMEEPVCWITNAFDRSPSELLWVDSDRWGPLQGALLNFSYGYGQIYVVPHQRIDGKVQGGMQRLPLKQFPTGIMRGRFHPDDGQLYCCGMFAWAGNQQQPGGLYRVRYTGQPLHVPVGFEVVKGGIQLTMTEELDAASVQAVDNYRIKVWDLKRLPRYGSEHHNEREWVVEKSELLKDGKTIRLSIPGLQPTRGLKILYSLKSDQGQRVSGEFHGSIVDM
ncbi:MAG: LamG-like jellyroll fold domain-containing protein [Planctomycetota bacterium]